MNTYVYKKVKSYSMSFSRYGPLKFGRDGLFSRARVAKSDFCRLVLESSNLEYESEYPVSSPSPSPESCVSNPSPSHESQRSVTKKNQTKKDNFKHNYMSIKVQS